MEPDRPFRALIAPQVLQVHLEDPGLIVLDCSFRLDEPEWGLSQFENGHLPGAQYVHLDEDLSSEIVPGKTGRHPVPHPVHFARRMRSWGISDTSTVVAYDQGPGPFAARLWWLVRYLGHDKVFVLDGGFNLWKSLGYSVETGAGRQVKQPGKFTPCVREWLLVHMQEVKEASVHGLRLVDARAKERFTGSQEPIDPVAGHIPGAESMPYQENLEERGTWKSADILQGMYGYLAADPESKPVFYCGSGVTGCHDLLAYFEAGFDNGALYGGSWSEWITDPENPVAQGE